MKLMCFLLPTVIGTKRGHVVCCAGVQRAGVDPQYEAGAAAVLGGGWLCFC